MTRVCINPGVSAITNDNGVGQVVHAQFKYLPACGIELVGPDSAEVIACHITQAGMPRVDVLHCHGLYFGDIPHAHYQRWHHDANMQIVAAARQAYAVTVPSAWVAEPFKRDMRLSPLVIGHGVDLDEWEPVTDARPFYALWNKNRASDVCDPLPALELARRGVDVVSTFGPELMPVHAGLRVVGPQPHAKMKELVRHAGAYLATTRETFGIGTLEALAAGVPVVGYAYGGTADIVEHGVSGWLVPEGDIDGLLAGIQWVQAHPEARQAARDRAAAFSWPAVAQRYADLYHQVAEEKRRENHKVTIVITNYNYGEYVSGAIESALAQADEVIVVDDASTDSSAAKIAQFGDRVESIIHQSNTGVAASRNDGIAAATGAYVVCLDADDQLDPRYVETLRRALIADRGLGIAYSGLGILQDNGTVNPNPWPPEFDWKAQTTPANPPSNCIPCAAMFRRSMWERAGGYKQVHAPAEDTEFFTRGLSVGFTAKRVTQEPLFWYRMHAGSASRTKTYKPIDTWHPWMRDQQYPIGAPNPAPVPVRSYAEPLISVIIPCGPGHARHLPTAIESLLGQTFRGWECIIADDTPTHSLILEQATGLRPYPFVRLAFTEKAGSGPGAARNAGLALARAPLVLFLDADDYLVPDALAQFLEAYVATQGRYIYSDWFAYRGGEMVHDEAIEYSQSEWLYKGYHAVSALIPAEWCRAVGGFDETIRGWEDWDFFLKLAIAGYCGHRHAAPLLVYRQDTGTIRDVSLHRSDELLAVLRDRYAAYGPGGDQHMASCCGGNADTLLAAKAAIAAANAPTGTEAAFLPQTHIAAEGPPTARLKFTGPQRGAITYVGRPSGRQYRFGNNPLEQYGDVDPRDVEYLLNFGVFELVSQPRVPIIPPQAEIAAPPPPPPAAAAVLGERPMLDLAGDLPAELEARVNQEAQRVRKQVREKAA